MSPALAGGLCTGPPGKSWLSFLNDALYVFSFALNVFLQSTLKLNICLRVIQIPSRGVSKVLHPGLSELLGSFVKLKLLLLLSLLIGSLITGNSERWVTNLFWNLCKMPAHPRLCVQGSVSLEGKRISWPTEQGASWEAQSRDYEATIEQQKWKGALQTDWVFRCLESKISYLNFETVCFLPSIKIADIT